MKNDNKNLNVDHCGLLLSYLTISIYIYIYLFTGFDNFYSFQISGIEYPSSNSFDAFLLETKIVCWI